MIIDTIRSLVLFLEKLKIKKFSGWLKLNFHKGNLSKKIERGAYENLD